jgi:ATP-dependent Clp protease ATP-binding subunit ClpA
LTGKFVTDRMQPDKAIDVLDEACAHAQATATLPPELERVVRERRRVDAAIRRRMARGERVDGGEGSGRDDGAAAGAAEPEDALESFTREIGPALERLGAEIEKLFGSPGPGSRGPGAAESGPARDPAPSSTRESLLERRDRLDGELRDGLKSMGIVVRGQDVARAVGVAVGKRIEWTG